MRQSAAQSTPAPIWPHAGCVWTRDNCPADPAGGLAACLHRFILSHRPCGTFACPAWGPALWPSPQMSCCGGHGSLADSTHPTEPMGQWHLPKGFPRQRTQSDGNVPPCHRHSDTLLRAGKLGRDTETQGTGQASLGALSCPVRHTERPSLLGPHPASTGNGPVTVALVKKQWPLSPGACLPAFWGLPSPDTFLRTGAAACAIQK